MRRREVPFDPPLIKSVSTLIRGTTGSTCVEGERLVATFYREGVGSTLLQRKTFNPSLIQREPISAVYRRSA